MEKTVTFDWRCTFDGVAGDTYQWRYFVRMLMNGEPLTLVKLDTESEARAVCDALQSAYFVGKMGGLAAAMDTLRRIGGGLTNG